VLLHVVADEADGQILLGAAQEQHRRHRADHELQSVPGRPQLLFHPASLGHVLAGTEHRADLPLGIFDDFVAPHHQALAAVARQQRHVDLLADAATLLEAVHEAFPHRLPAGLRNEVAIPVLAHDLLRLVAQRAAAAAIDALDGAVALKHHGDGRRVVQIELQLPALGAQPLIGPDTLAHVAEGRHQIGPFRDPDGEGVDVGHEQSAVPAPHRHVQGLATAFDRQPMEVLQHLGQGMVGMDVLDRERGQLLLAAAEILGHAAVAGHEPSGLRVDDQQAVHGLLEQGLEAQFGLPGLGQGLFPIGHVAHDPHHVPAALQA
jgi:hypothetical protein